MQRATTDLTWRRLPASALSNDKALKHEWDRLNAAHLDLPFLCADAIITALEEFGSGHELLLVAEHKGRTAAMLLLAPDGFLRWRTFQPSQIPLGAWVFEQGLSPRAICQSAMRGPLPASLVLSITQIDPLQTVRDDDAPDTWHCDYIDTAWIDVQGSFDEYWAARGKNLRQNLRKQRNRLATEGTTTTLICLREPADMAPAVTRYGMLETTGWKASEGTAVDATTPQGRFYTRLLELAARRGEGLVFEYRFGDRTVAMNLCLLRRGTLVVLKTAYDESLPKSISSAVLLREEVLQQAFGGDEIKRIEFYGRVHEWHTKLTNCKRTLYHLTKYRWPLLKRLAQRRRAAAIDAPAPASAAEPAAQAVD